ncbi:hypothetical protein AMECASPLE_013868 [Ameca splendens]|uniref:Secreted protein n=1 Tax=Ameca splendens TaxID=208324 RepID=A0ABV0ZAB7_9TELE
MLTRVTVMGMVGLGSSISTHSIPLGLASPFMTRRGRRGLQLAHISSFIERLMKPILALLLISPLNRTHLGNRSVSDPLLVLDDGFMADSRSSLFPVPAQNLLVHRTAHIGRPHKKAW